MPLIGVDHTTQERFYEILERERMMGTDTLVNLALDAYEALTPSASSFARRLESARAGSHYCEIIADEERVAS